MGSNARPTMHSISGMNVVPDWSEATWHHMAVSLAAFANGFWLHIMHGPSRSPANGLLHPKEFCANPLPSDKKEGQIWGAFLFVWRGGELFLLGAFPCFFLGKPLFPLIPLYDERKSYVCILRKSFLSVAKPWEKKKEVKKEQKRNK